MTGRDNFIRLPNEIRQHIFQWLVRLSAGHKEVPEGGVVKVRRRQEPRWQLRSESNLCWISEVKGVHGDDPLLRSLQVPLCSCSAGALSLFLGQSCLYILRQICARRSDPEQTDEFLNYGNGPEFNLSRRSECSFCQSCRSGKDLYIRFGAPKRRTSLSK